MREVSIGRVGALLTVFFRSEAPRDYAEAGESDRDAFARFFGAMLDAGVLLPPSQFEAWFISLAHGPRGRGRDGRGRPDGVPRMTGTPALATVEVAGQPAAGPDAGPRGSSDPRADRYLRACRREPVDATPVWFMRQAGRSLPEFRAVRERASLIEITRDPALCAEVTLQPVRRLGVDAAILFADITTPFTGLGRGLRHQPGRRSGHRAPDPDRRRRRPPRAVRPRGRRRSAPRGDPAHPGRLAGPAHRVRRGAVHPRLLPHRGRPVARVPADPDLHARRAGGLGGAHGPASSRRPIGYLAAQVAAGAQAVQVFDSWVGGLGPRDYDLHVGPWMRRLFDGLAALGVPRTHFGIGTAGLLARQAEAGGDVIGLDWRIALADGWELVGDRAVQGNLDPALLLGPFEAVADAARWILDQAGGRPGHVFNLGHGVLPETDPDDLRRLVDLVHERTSRRSAQ